MGKIEGHPLGGVEEGSSHLVRWEVVSRPLDLGRLGVGNIRGRNQALVAK